MLNWVRFQREIKVEVADAVWTHSLTLKYRAEYIPWILHLRVVWEIMPNDLARADKNTVQLYKLIMSGPEKFINLESYYFIDKLIIINLNSF